MRCLAAPAVSLTGLALAVCPMAQADPGPDDIYSKYLSEEGVNHQNRMSDADMQMWGHTVCLVLSKNPTHQTYLNAGQMLVDTKIFDHREADLIEYSAIAAYCPQYRGLDKP
jgi:hypothetical protein